MPSKKKPHKFDDNHSRLMGKLADQLENAGESRLAPVDLATAHLRLHGLEEWGCKFCGVAKAIVDCFAGLEERSGFELCEQVRSMVGEIKARKAKVERTISALHLKRLEKEKENLRRLGHPEEHKDVRVLLRGQAANAPLPTVVAREPTLAGIEEKLEAILAPLKNALEMCEPLVVALAEAERRVAGGVALTSLVEPRKRTTDEQIDIKVDCYLAQHGWTDEEIREAFHKDPPHSRTADSIRLRVKRAKDDGKPMLIWPWPDQERRKEADALLAILNFVNMPTTR